MIVLPVFGGATISMRCPSPIGATMSITRVKSSFDVVSRTDRKSTRLNSSHLVISYAVFCLKIERKAESAGHGTVNLEPRQGGGQDSDFLFAPCCAQRVMYAQLGRASATAIEELYCQAAMQAL